MGDGLNFWDSKLEDTVRRAGELATRRPASSDVVDWLSLYEEDSPTSSNQGTANLPYQRWFRFKEAFSPKFVADTIASLPHPVNRVLDPFGGSGTTALTCGFLGIDSVSLEVNPFLADLIAAKLTPVLPSSILSAYEHLRANLRIKPVDRAVPVGMPVTMREPGMKDRWVFSAGVYDTIRALVRGLDELPAVERRLIRVLLGSVLVQNSNVLINGKGRRYRRNWETRTRTGQNLLDDLDAAIDAAISDLTRFSAPTGANHEIRCGDARQLIKAVDEVDLAIFSPPYPNSFDYTDVYNLELWMLGYLNTGSQNRALRQSTLRSHVQIAWEDPPNPVTSSPALKAALAALDERRSELWNPRIPEMVASYFEDMQDILAELGRVLGADRHAVIAIGDSQYAGVLIDVAKIMGDLVGDAGFSLVKSEAIRSMRASSQHGGGLVLKEHCLVLKRN